MLTLVVINNVSYICEPKYTDDILEKITPHCEVSIKGGICQRRLLHRPHSITLQDCIIYNSFIQNSFMHQLTILNSLGADLPLCQILGRKLPGSLIAHLAVSSDIGNSADFAYVLEMVTMFRVRIQILITL